MAGPSTNWSIYTISAAPSPKPAAKSKKSNPIYLFYEDPTDCDTKGKKDEGSAVAVEQIFLGRRDTIGFRRASLKAETIQMLMFVKAHLRVEREESKKHEGS
ncbi:hypothetical protein B0H14DRAFT_3497097 [Mycena olivaceomarginata]|nr:hypothetical protein B0H14DRAFT_3497097 [Mycena olivaceomarginata]